MSVFALVVDDDEDIRFLTSIALESTAGWEVVTAGGGEEALGLAAQRPPDVVLMDLMMPGLDGVATAKRLRAEPATSAVPVVLFTAKEPVGGAPAPWDGVEIAGVLTKPFDPMRLATAVSELLGW